MPELTKLLTWIGVGFAATSILIPLLMGFALIFLLTGWLVGYLDKRGELDGLHADFKLRWRHRWPHNNDDPRR